MAVRTVSRRQLALKAAVIVAQTLLMRQMGRTVKAGFDPNQARDNQGQWSETGAGGHLVFSRPSRTTRFSDATESSNFGQEAYGEWQASLTPAEADALSAYKGSSFLAINEHLRGIREDMSPRTQERIKLIEQALDKAPPLPEDILMYRGMPASAFGPNGLNNELVGSVIQDNGYVSTTLVYDIAARQFGDSVVVKIVVPRGSRGAYIEPSNRITSSSEAEFLLPRGTQFLITEIDLDSIPIRVTMIAKTP